VFDTESGLPHDRVNRIYLDSKGFLWICTDDRLSRFDGHQFVNYVGMDVHQATISVAVRDSSGKLIMESIIETKASSPG
jgi:ligand-binding sensor domain-containing protein